MLACYINNMLECHSSVKIYNNVSQTMYSNNVTIDENDMNDFFIEN